MVSALFQSCSRANGGTREFKNDGISFEWKCIEDKYKSELEHMKIGQATCVPHILCRVLNVVEQVPLRKPLNSVAMYRWNGD